ncbi:MAG TPA: hypothetical protein V6D28_06390 [Leptolyngbyaceae cyanobacterium]
MVIKKNGLLLTFLTVALTAPILTTEIAQNKFKDSLVVAQTSPRTSVNLPQQKFLPATGWLGLATVVGEGRHKFHWSPSHPNGQMVIFDNAEAWTQVRAGTPLVAVAPGFKQRVTFLRSSEEGYGCDRVPTQMAAFSAPRRPPEGPVWLLPERDAATATALTLQKLPLSQVPPALLPRPLPRNSNARAWKAGSIIILQQKQSGYKVKLTAANNSQVIFSKLEERYFFSGDDRRPTLNLATANGEPGISEPIGAFQLKTGAAPLLVFWQPGYEGNAFSVLVPQGRTAKLVEGGGIYFCAY